MSQLYETYALDLLLILTLGWWLMWCLKPPRDAPDTYRRAVLNEVVDALMSGPEAPGGPALRAAGAATPSPNLEKGLADIRNRDPRFDPAYFLDHARTRYMSVLRAYVDGDIKALGAHVSHDLLTALSARIQARSAPPRYDSRDIPAPQMLDAGVTAGSAWIVVRFPTQNGAAVWIFARDIGAPRTTWTLAATSGGIIGKTP